jgi:hypothetical protein
VKRFVRSEGYARARLVSGALFVVLGAFTLYRTLGIAGFSAAAVPGCVLGAAMIALGSLRFRDYLRARAR